jgi:hypothetical protein
MHKNNASAQKRHVCKKPTVDSGPRAVCARSAPTVIAVHRWGVDVAQQSMIFITRTTISNIDSIYAYTTHVTSPRHVTTSRRPTIHHRSHPSVGRLHVVISNSKITPFTHVCIDPKSTLIRSFCYRKSIYLDMWLGQDFSRIFY